MRLFIIKKKTLFTYLFVLILAIIALFVFIGYNKTEEIFNQDVYYQGNVDEKVIAFACNVDWGNENIPDMLKIFKDNNIKITFFVTGRWANENPDILKTIYEEGHEIGNHGYNHIDYNKLSYEKNKEEISRAHEVIKSVLNIDSKYFSPPSGAYNENTVKASKDLNYEMIMWSIDTIDWRKDSIKDVIYKRVTTKAHNAGIVLMHPKEETVKALPDIINYLYKNGYKVGRISDVIKMDN